MKIQVGVGTREEFEHFLKAGADEFYCGFKTIPGHLYGGVTFDSVDEVAEAVKLAHASGKKFYFAANEIQAHALNETVAFIKELHSRGIDGVIIRDLAVLSALKPGKLPLEIILTSLSPCYNAGSLDFYRGLGVTRLALPEQLLPREAEGLIRNKWGIGTEIFLMAREYCVVLNGLCYLKQFNGQCLCRKEFRTGGRKFVMAKPTAEEHFSRLYDFHKLGVPVLKIGRHPAKDYAKILFGEALAVNKLLGSGLSKKEFTRLALKYHAKIGTFLEKCTNKP